MQNPRAHRSFTGLPGPHLQLAPAVLRILFVPLGITLAEPRRGEREGAAGGGGALPQVREEGRHGPTTSEEFIHILPARLHSELGLTARRAGIASTLARKAAISGVCIIQLPRYPCV